MHICSLSPADSEPTAHSRAEVGQTNLPNQNDFHGKCLRLFADKGYSTSAGPTLVCPPAGDLKQHDQGIRGRESADTYCPPAAGTDVYVA